MSARIIADPDSCEGFGMCQTMAVDFFEVGAGGPVIVLEPEPPEDRLEEVRAAVESCPVMALRLLEH